MFSVYARKYNPNPDKGFPAPGENEILLFTIPTQDGNPRPFLSAVVNNEMGNAGSFEFSVDKASKFNNLFIPMRTLVRVAYNGETIFYGRALTVDTDMFMTSKIHCEGCQTFLMDSLFEGKKNGYTVMLDEYLTMLLDAHNTCMRNSPEKQIFAGEIPGNYSSSIIPEQRITIDRQKFGSGTGYKTVKDCLDEMAADYGGHLRVRYNDSDGKLYLDWLKHYFNAQPNDQLMTIRRNTIDWSHVVEVNNIFTYVLPVGKDGKYLDGGKGGKVEPGGNDKYFWIRCNAVCDNSPDEPGHAWATPHSILKTKVSDDPTKTTVVALHQETYAGFTLKSWSFTPDSINLRGGNTFLMPRSDVRATAHYKKDSSGGSDPSDPGDPL